jgi:hypothetical protein
MFHRLRLVLLLVLVTAVFVITTQVVSTQEAPPRPSRTIEELPRLPGAEVEEGEAPSPASAAPAVILPWSKRTFQSYRDGNWEIYTSNDDGSGEARLTVHSAIDMHPRLNRGATHIAFASKRDGVYEIYTMNVERLRRHAPDLHRQRQRLPGLVARWDKARLPVLPGWPGGDLHHEHRRFRPDAPDGRRRL